MSSFFLIGKGPDNELVLLSSAPLATRKDALSELSKLTAESGFNHWDAEVFVLDLETGTPVLLMRPEAPAPAAATESVHEAADVEQPKDEELVEAEALEADEGPKDEEPVLLSEAAPEVVAEAVEEPEVDHALAAVIEDLAAETTEVATVVEAPEPVADTGGGSDATPVLAGASETEEVDTAYAEVVVEAVVEESSTLKAALERTAAQMAASGITPPESVGPADFDDASSAEAPLEPLEPEAAWPWATSTDDDSPAFSLSALEEPGLDEGSLVRAAGDDETMAVSRPVILGAYGESPDTATAAESTPSEVLPKVADDVATEAGPEVPLTAESEQSAVEEVESDFILDLEQIAATSQSEPAGYQLADAPREMTCDDCVYVETCPNKDQRDPTTCGSFQWK